MSWVVEVVIFIFLSPDPCVRRERIILLKIHNYNSDICPKPLLLILSMGKVLPFFGSAPLQGRYGTNSSFTSSLYINIASLFPFISSSLILPLLLYTFCCIWTGRSSVFMALLHQYLWEEFILTDHNNYKTSKTSKTLWFIHINMENSIRTIQMIVLCLTLISIYRCDCFFFFLKVIEYCTITLKIQANVQTYT